MWVSDQLTTTASLWFLRCARAQMANKLIDYFESMFIHTSKPSQYGDIVEIQINPMERYLITRDPEHIKTVLTGKFASFGKGEQFHDLWRPFLGDSIFTTDGAMWHDSRSLIRPMFMKDRVSDLAIFERWVSALVEHIPAGEEIDIMDLFYRMTLDVTTDFLLGTSVNSLSNPRDEFAQAFNEVQSIQMLLTLLGPFEPLIPRWKYHSGIKTIDRFVMPFIESALALPRDELEKLGGSDKKFTFLHSVARFTRDPRVLRDQIVAVLLAGRDTTAATLSWTFYQLSRYPDKFAKLRLEILDKVGRTKRPSYEDLKGMTYLRHVLDETLRMYPAVPYNIRTALEDTTLPGPSGQPNISVVEGDSVVYSSLSMQRCAALYPDRTEKGEKLPDPAIFEPERWDKWTPKPWTYVPFNGGPRICVGQNFAMTEMAYCVVRILQKFDRLEYRGDWHAQNHVADIVGRPEQGVKVKLWEERVQFAGSDKRFQKVLDIASRMDTNSLVILLPPTLGTILFPFSLSNNMTNYARLPAGVTLDVKPFEAHVPEEKLQHFKKLLELSPIAPAVFENTNAGQRYGLKRDWLENAKKVWLTDFDWREQERRINSFPNFKASVNDGNGNTIEVQFLALFSERADAIPIAFFHGWPGSICEFLDLLDILKDRYSSKDLPYHVIVPSLPGYAYSSGPPLDTDYGIDIAAGAMHNLMVGLGFGSGYLAQGGDLGSFVSRLLATNYDACKGMHVNMMAVTPPEDLDKLPPDEQEKKVMQKAAEFIDTGYAFALEQGTRPATIGFVLSASPLALLSWIGEKFLEWTDDNPPLEKILESITLYWMTDTIPRCMYHNRALGNSNDDPKISRISVITSMTALKLPYVEKPSGYSLFAQEILPVPKNWAAKNCNLVSFNQHERGGHFAAMERPRELLDDVEEYIKVAWKTPDSH
ncbi:cytochrome p450 alkane hydroxylase [Seiridium cupressi]